MRDPNNPCLFCDSKKSGIAHENDLAYASFDSYPVSHHHCAAAAGDMSQRQNKYTCIAPN